MQHWGTVVLIMHRHISQPEWLAWELRRSETRGADTRSWTIAEGEIHTPADARDPDGAVRVCLEAALAGLRPAPAAVDQTVSVCV